MLRLAERRPDQEIIEQLRDLLRDAENGKVVGLLAAVHYGGSGFGYFGGGSMCSTPALGLQALVTLTTKLLTAN